MKRILIIHPALVVGGAESVLINYLKILSKPHDKYEVELLLIENRVGFNLDKIPCNIKINYLLSDIESEFLVYSYANSNKNNNSNYKYYESWFYGIKERINSRLLSKINSNKYDIIIDFHRLLSGFDYFINKFDVSKSIKLLYWIHSDYLLDCWKNDRNYYSYILSKYDHFIAINHDMKNRCKNILTSLNVINNNVDVLYNPLDIDDILYKANHLKSNNEMLLHDDFILQVSRIDVGKNHLEMIEIFHELKKRGIKEKLYIIGGGDTKQLQEKINNLNLSEECLLLGHKDNPYPFMKKAKLFIHTSLFEGLAMVLIESMACGTPVVSYDCPTGPKEVLDNGKYGALIPLHDKEKFIQKTYELLTNEEQRMRYIALLPEAVERFSFEKISEQLESLLDNL